MTETAERDLDRQRLTARVMIGKAFLIKTPACKKLYAHIERWLTCGMLGAVVYGRPRLGKTSAARWSLSVLRQLVAPVAWVEVPVRKQHLENEGAFFQYLLRCARNKWQNKGTVADKRDRFTEALITRALRSPIKTVILFFDEAQLLTELHYSWLINISNELEARGLRLFCLLVGQHQLITRKDTFIVEGLDEIVGRFMVDHWAFPGIESLADLTQCLIAYEEVIYPEKNGAPFLAYYVPLALESGWSLKTTAETFWNAFTDVWSGAGRTDGVVIPMHYMSSALLIFLNQLCRIDTNALVVTETMVTAAVKRCGFAGAIVTLPAPKGPSARQASERGNSASK